MDYLAAAVGGDRVGGGVVVHGRGTMAAVGEIPLVFGEILEALVSACEDLLETGSGERLYGREGERDIKGTPFESQLSPACCGYTDQCCNNRHFSKDG